MAYYSAPRVARGILTMTREAHFKCVIQCMSKIQDGLTRVVTQCSPVVADFNGQDALLKDILTLRQESQHFAQAAIPQALRKALYIVEHGKSAKDVIQAAKFIKSVADGQTVKGKTINGIVKKFSNQELNTALQETNEQ